MGATAKIAISAARLTGLIDRIVQYIVKQMLIDIIQLESIIALMYSKGLLQIAISDQLLMISDVLEVNKTIKVDMSKSPADLFGLLPGSLKNMPLASLLYYQRICILEFRNPSIQLLVFPHYSSAIALYRFHYQIPDSHYQLAAFLKKKISNLKALY